jgi:predicted O-methyltransferase YrrM
MNGALPTYLESALTAIFADHNLINIQQHEWEMRTFLAMVLDELKPERTVELGTYKGFTGALLSLVTSRQTVTVDATDYGTSEAKPYGHHLDFVAGDAADKDSVIVTMATLGGPIDLLFIDDGHYYETIVKEFELWAPYVRKGGMIAFHDINEKANIGPHGTQPDCIQVPRFWKELNGDKIEIIADERHSGFKGVIPHGGIGILKL